MLVPDLLLHSREVHTVFDLLGDKENDITYALGWALSRSEQLLSVLLDDVFDEELGRVLAQAVRTPSSRCPSARQSGRPHAFQ